MAVHFKIDGKFLLITLFSEIKGDAAADPQEQSDSIQSDKNS